MRDFSLFDKQAILKSIPCPYLRDASNWLNSILNISEATHPSAEDKTSYCHDLTAIRMATLGKPFAPNTTLDAFKTLCALLTYVEPEIVSAGLVKSFAGMVENTSTAPPKIFQSLLPVMYRLHTIMSPGLLDSIGTVIKDCGAPVAIQTSEILTAVLERSAIETITPDYILSYRKSLWTV